MHMRTKGRTCGAGSTMASPLRLAADETLRLASRWEPCLSTGTYLLVSKDAPRYSLDNHGNATMVGDGSDLPTPPRGVVQRGLLLPSPESVMSELELPRKQETEAAMDVILELAKTVRVMPSHPEPV